MKLCVLLVNIFRALLISGTLSISSANAQEGWATFRGGKQNLGNSPYALKTSTQTTAQAIKLGGLLWATPVIDSAGRVFLGSSNKRIFALDSNGNRLWTASLLDRADSLVDSAAALTTDGQLVVPGGDGFLHSFDVKTGAVNWTFRAHGASDDSHSSGVTVNSFEGNVQQGPNGWLYAGSDNGDLYCVDLQGRERWFFHTGMMIWSAPTFAVDGSWMAFGSLDGYVYLLDPQTGKLLTKLKVGSDVKASIATDGRSMLYFGAADGLFRAVEIRRETSGLKLKLRWSYSAGSEIYSSAALGPDSVTFGSMGGTVHSLTLNGKVRWTYPTYSPVASSPLLTTDHRVIFGAANGKLYVLDHATGMRDWSLQTSSLTRKVNLDSSAVLDSRGSIWVGSYQGILHRIGGAVCSGPIPDTRCEFGGHADTPRFGMSSIPENQALLRYESFEEGFQDHPSRPLDKTALLHLRLAAYSNGQFLSDAAISASGVDIRLWKNGQQVRDPSREMNWNVSSDGKYLNIHSSTFWTSGAHYVLEVRGRYYRQTSWFWDRLKWFGLKKFEGHFEFEVAPATTLAVDEPFKRGWQMHSLYLNQPSALDTYIPAALDGQAFIVKPFGMTNDEANFLLLALPALPGEKGVTFTPEPARTNTLQAMRSGNGLLARGNFKLSAMGGTVSFQDFLLAARVGPTENLEAVEIGAVASCRQIQGNGSNYQFPFSLVNQVCDPWLRMIAYLNIQATPLEPRHGGNAVAVEVSPRKTFPWTRDLTATLRFHPSTPVSAGPHLFSAILYDSATKEVLAKQFTRLEITEGNATPPLSVSLAGFASGARKSTSTFAFFWDTEELIPAERSVTSEQKFSR